MLGAGKFRARHRNAVNFDFNAFAKRDSVRHRFAERREPSLRQECGRTLHAPGVCLSANIMGGDPSAGWARHALRAAVSGRRGASVLGPPTCEKQYVAVQFASAFATWEKSPPDPRILPHREQRCLGFASLAGTRQARVVPAFEAAAEADKPECRRIVTG